MSLELKIMQNSLSVHCDYQNVELKTEEIPLISQATACVFNQFKLLLPIVNVSIDSIQIVKNVTTLKETAQNVQTGKDKAVKDKIKNMLIKAVCIIGIAIAILGTIAFIAFFPGNSILPLKLLPGLMVGLPFMMGLAYQSDISSNLSQDENLLKQQKQDMEAQLAEAINFFNQDFTPFKETLVQEIDDLDTSFKMMAKMPSMCTTGKAELENRKKRYELALEQLDKAITYYKQFLPPAPTAEVLPIPSAPPEEESVYPRLDNI